MEGLGSVRLTTATVGNIIAKTPNFIVWRFCFYLKGHCGQLFLRYQIMALNVVF